MKTLTLLLICLLPSLTYAFDSETISVRSAGKLQNDESIDLSKEIERSPSISLQKADSSQGTGSNNRLANRYSDSVQFDLFDAWVDLSGDLDQDGYYHEIKVSFDADVNTQTTEAVYAKIFLSYQGGPWFLLTTTDLFEIYGNSSNDSFEVFNQLEQGFEPGDYEVLIELHSLYHSGIVSQEILQFDRYGYLITLEDLDHDDPYYTVTYVDSYGYVAAGGFSIPGLIFMGLMAMLKIRFSRRH